MFSICPLCGTPSALDAAKNSFLCPKCGFSRPLSLDCPEAAGQFNSQEEMRSTVGLPVNWPPAASPKRPTKSARAKALSVALMLMFGVGSLVLGVLISVKGVLSIVRQQQALATFRPVQAKVIGATCTPDKQNRGSLAFVFRAVFGANHRVRVSYRYEVDGKEYVTDKVGLPGVNRTTGRKTWAERITAGYVPGQPCTAYYDPADSSQSFLLKERDFDPYQATVIGLFFSLLGLLILSAPAIEELCLGTLAVASACVCKVLLLVLAVICFGGSCWALAHYFIHADHPLAQSWSPLASSLFAGFLTLPICLVVVANIARRRWAPPRIAFSAKAERTDIQGI
jgi:hypothetical protein